VFLFGDQDILGVVRFGAADMKGQLFWICPSLEDKNSLTAKVQWQIRILGQNLMQKEKNQGCLAEESKFDGNGRS
jgi:hypothetical protein